MVVVGFQIWGSSKTSLLDIWHKATNLSKSEAIRFECSLIPVTWSYHSFLIWMHLLIKRLTRSFEFFSINWLIRNVIRFFNIFLRQSTWIRVIKHTTLTESSIFLIFREVNRCLSWRNFRCARFQLTIVMCCCCIKTVLSIAWNKLIELLLCYGRVHVFISLLGLVGWHFNC